MSTCYLTRIASCIPNSFCKWNFLHFHIKHPQKLGRHISFGVVNTEAKKRWLTGPRESEKDEKEKEEERGGDGEKELFSAINFPAAAEISHGDRAARPTD